MNYSSNLLLFSTNKSFFNTLLVNKSIIMGAPLWGTCKSILAAVAMDKNVIKKIIPNGIAFTPQNITGAGEHPVIFMFNKQKIRIFFSWLIINYYEMIPLIPWVHLEGKPDKQYQMSPILYVSNPFIVLGARIMWHLNKVWAAMKVAPPIDEFQKLKYLNERVIRKKMDAIEMYAEADGQPGAPQSFPHLQTLSPMLLTDALINAPGPVFYTAVYQVTMIEIQGAKVNFKVMDIEGLPKQEFNVASINEKVLGGFYINFSWKLFWPKKVN